MTRTACTHCTICSCLRASGTERDYVVSYSLCCTLVWCVRGLSCSTVSWAHLGNVTGVKSGEPGAYYVTLFLQFGNRRLLARPGLCRTVRRGHNRQSRHCGVPHSASFFVLHSILICNCLDFFKFECNSRVHGVIHHHVDAQCHYVCHSIASVTLHSG